MRPEPPHMVVHAEPQTAYGLAGVPVAPEAPAGAVVWEASRC